MNRKCARRRHCRRRRPRRRRALLLRAIRSREAAARARLIRECRLRRAFARLSRGEFCKRLSERASDDLSRSSRFLEGIACCAIAVRGIKSARSHSSVLISSSGASAFLDNCLRYEDRHVVAPRLITHVLLQAPSRATRGNGYRRTMEAEYRKCFRSLRETFPTLLITADTDREGGRNRKERWHGTSIGT